MPRYNNSLNNFKYKLTKSACNSLEKLKFLKENNLLAHDDCTDDYDNTILHSIVQTCKDHRIIEFLIKSGMRLDVKNIRGLSPWMLYILYNESQNPIIHEIVLNNEVTHKDIHTSTGDNIIHFAVRYKSFWVLNIISVTSKMLLHTNKDGFKPIELAIFLGQTKFFNYLIIQCRVKLEPAQMQLLRLAHAALSGGFIKSAQALIRENKNELTKQDAVGRNLLHIAIMKSDIEIFKEIFRLYLSYNPDAILMEDYYGKNVLAYAIEQHADFKIVEILLGQSQGLIKRSSINRKNILHYLAASSLNYDQNFFILKSAQARAINHLEYYGKTELPIHIAVKANNINFVMAYLDIFWDDKNIIQHIVKELKTSNTTIKNNWYKVLEFILKVGNFRKECDYKDKSNNTLLHLAAKMGEVRCIKLLQEYAGLDPNAVNKKGLKPVHVCAVGIDNTSLFRELVTTLLNSKPRVVDI